MRNIKYKEEEKEMKTRGLWIFVLGLVLIGLVLGGCETMEPVATYTSPNVPEEGGVKLTKITEIEDGVCGPKFSVVEKNKILYEVIKFFDISKDGTKIAYMGLKNNTSNLFVKSLTGGKATLQRTFSENVNDVSFSPDGNWLAFTDYRDGSWNVYIVGAESGSAIRQITTTKMPKSWPVFSKDGSLVFFVQSETQGFGGKTFSTDYLWSYDLKKGILMQYTKGSFPTLTPDGKGVLVSRLNRETDFNELWFVDLEKGQEFVLLSSKERGFFESAISPDGKRVAVVTQTKREDTPTNLDIYLINIDGTGLTQLTSHPGHDLYPQWSPDGNSLFFLSQRGSEKGEYNIWRMDLR